LAALVVASSCPAAQAAATPYQRGFNLQYGLEYDGRIRKCDSAAQPNCLSTSSISNLYSPPWLANEEDPQAASQVRQQLFFYLFTPLSLICPALETHKLGRRHAIPPVHLSTSSTRASRLTQPLAPALQAFDDALRALSPATEQLTSEPTPGGGVYMRYRVPSSFEYDIVE
jgi:hypothetical protein